MVKRKSVPGALARDNIIIDNNREDTFLYRLNPRSDKELTQIAEELIAFIQNPDVLTLAEFSTHKKITLQRLKELGKRNEDLSNALEVAKQVIGSRREKGALLGKFNSGFVLATHALYDADYKDFIEWRTKLKNSETSENGYVPAINIYNSEQKK